MKTHSSDPSVSDPGQIISTASATVPTRSSTELMITRTLQIKLNPPTAVANATVPQREALAFGLTVTSPLTVSSRLLKVLSKCFTVLTVLGRFPKPPAVETKAPGLGKLRLVVGSPERSCHRANSCKIQYLSIERIRGKRAGR